MRPHGRKPKGQTKPGTLRSLHVLWSLLFMCLCMCMFLYMSISCTHIVDISYPSRSGIPLKVDTVSTMNSSRSPSNSFVVALPSITTLPEPAMFLQDSQSTLPESSLLTAVLPVTSSSVSHLGPIIRTLLIHSRYLTEVILVSPQSIQTEIRRVLRSIVAAEGQRVHVELSLLPWPPNMNEDAAILHVSRQATTDFILFLDDSGLELVGTRALESLMLLEPPSVAAPFGPRGINSTDTGLTCISTEEDFRPASFLVPPYVMPSFLLPQHDLNPDNVFGVWSALGKHITQTQIERDMVGGFVVGYQIESTNAGWCPSEILQSNHSLQLEYVDSHKSRPFDEVGDSSTDGSREPPSNPTSPPNPHSFGVFALVLPSLRDLRSFSAAACRLQHAGHTIKSLLYAEEQNPDFITNNEDLHLLSDECDLGYDAFFSAESTSKELADILDWFSCLSPVPDVVIASSHKEGHLVLGIPFQEQSSSHVISVLQIAQEDLPYCDWMGTLTLQEFKNWHVPRVDISVITNNRPHSLTRLLSSLSSARYFGDTLNLRINIEQTADAETLQVVDDFQWVRGGLFIHHRIIHGGLLPAIVESWYPHSNDSYGLILEDDVELSPLFYAWIKLSLLHYRYGRFEDRSSQLFGISLYQQKHLELRPGGRHQFNARDAFATAGFADPSTPYLSQIPCSWGAVYFPEHWREFHAYLTFRLSETAWDVNQVVVPGVRSNKWTRSWKKYFIELVYLRGYVMLYPNWEDYASLSTNHLEVGSHVKDVPKDIYLRKKKLFLLPLMDLPHADASSAPATGLLDLPNGSLPQWSALPWLDLFGIPVVEQALMERGRARRRELTGCMDVMGEKYDVWDLLCLGD